MSKVSYVDAGEMIDGDAVRPPCIENGPGHWFCVTHDEQLANNMQKDGHIHDGTHRLAWFCHEHGYEAP